MIYYKRRNYCQRTWQPRSRFF